MEVTNELLDDGPALVRALDDLKERFHQGMERAHRVAVGAVAYDQDEYDPARGTVMMVVSALTVRDPEWVRLVMEHARRAVAEDQAALRRG